MKITLEPALQSDKDFVQNLARFYIYEMSRYCGFLPTWETPANGLYECIDLSRYWDDPSCHPFIIRVDNELAGFALVDKLGSTPDVDWNIGEFFVVAKFQKKGVGRTAARQVFDRYRGCWEVMQMPDNKAAIDFWRNVIQDYSQGVFTTSQKTILQPRPHPMVVLKFVNKSPS